MIHLDLYTDLPKVRAAFDAGELQCQKEIGANCSYAGPCAIGVMHPEAPTLPSASPINHLFHRYVMVPTAQEQDFCDLQDAHDRVMTSDEDYRKPLSYLQETLERLEKIYVR